MAEKKKGGIGKKQSGRKNKKKNKKEGLTGTMAQARALLLRAALSEGVKSKTFGILRENNLSYGEDVYDVNFDEAEAAVGE